MTGKIMAGAIVVVAAAAGIALWYLQIYGYYEELKPDAAATFRMTSVATGVPEPVLIENFRGIDAESSPIRYRACFTLPNSQAMLSETYVIYESPEPLVAPGWFDCFDAAGIAAALQDGRALAFLGEKNIAYGVDRVIAVTETGEGFAWHQLNDCGRKSYDGTPTGEACPPREGTD